MPRTLEYQSYSAPTIPHIEDTFTFPEELEESKKIKYALEVVTNKYLFYLQAAASAYKYPGMPNILEGVYDKLTHTNDVIKAAIETFEPGNSATLEDVVLAAIYHDMYRSFQGFYFFDYRDGVTGYKHGEEAATFMREKIPAEFISEQVIVAVNSHSKFTPDNQEYLTLVIRDIDKIAIIRRITQIQDRLERTRDSVLESGLSEDIKATFRRQTDIQPSVLNPEIIPHLENKTLLDGKLRKTKLDELVYHLAWIWDLNTQKARQIFAKERLPEKIILYLQEKVNPEPLVIEKLKKYVLSWYVEFNLGEPDYTGK